MRNKSLLSPKAAGHRLGETNVATKIGNWVSVFFLGILLAVYPEGKHMEITIGMVGLTVLTIMLGLLLAWIIYVSLAKRFPRGTSSMFRISIFFMLAVGCSSLAMGTATYMNRTFADKQIFYKEVLVKEKASGSRNRYRTSSEVRLLYVAFDGGTERIHVEEGFWLSVSEGSMITLRLRTGLLGYPFVVGYEKLNSTKKM